MPKTKPNQNSKLKKTIKTTIAILEAWSVNPIGHRNTWRRNFIEHAAWMKEQLKAKR